MYRGGLFRYAVLGIDKPTGHLANAIHRQRVGQGLAVKVSGYRDLMDTKHFCQLGVGQVPGFFEFD